MTRVSQPKTRKWRFGTGNIINMNLLMISGARRRNDIIRGESNSNEEESNKRELTQMRLQDNPDSAGTIEHC